VIGDGAFPSGIVFEAFNNIAGMAQNVLVVLNDNKMSICPRTGGLARIGCKQKCQEKQLQRYVLPFYPLS
jgi:deoxyxylulose-5-phosphate synthase